MYLRDGYQNQLQWQVIVKGLYSTLCKLIDIVLDIGHHRLQACDHTWD